MLTLPWHCFSPFVGHGSMENDGLTRGAIPGGDWWVEIRSLLLIVLLVNCYISSLIRVLGYVSFLNLVHLLLRVYGYYFISSLFRPWSCLEHCKSWARVNCCNFRPWNCWSCCKFLKLQYQMFMFFPVCVLLLWFIICTWQVAEGAKSAGASRVIGIDIDSNKYDTGIYQAWLTY